MNSNSDTIYLDHAATSWPKPDEVGQALMHCFTDLFANAGRSGNAASRRSAEEVFRIRENVAGLLGVSDSRNVAFTSGATEGLNLVLKGFLGQGDLVFVSPMEHNSVMRPLQRLAETRAVRVQILPGDRFGAVDWEAAARMARTRPPRLVAVNHASNVNGMVQDLRAVREALPDSAILVDASQTAGVVPIDVERDGIDFLACSAHKGLLGPTGVGACTIGPDLPVQPLCEGGTGSRSAQMTQPDVRPDRYEAGTLNLHGIVALGGALDYIASAGLTGDLKRRLSAILLSGLARIPGVELHSPTDGTALMAAFTVDGLSPDQVTQRLESNDRILCRPGLQCSPAAHRHLGTFPDGVVRFSPGYANTAEQMHRAVEAVAEVARIRH